MKKIIINADDFGYSKIFNEEILKLAENKKITGISVMVDYINFEQKNQIKRIIKYKNILGLHVDFENIDLKKQILKMKSKDNLEYLLKFLILNQLF